jgi:glucosamine--fructose-6-phosphate aminotransferase (isomerizing)
VVFTSDTDTEVLAQLVAKMRRDFPDATHVQSVRMALKQVHGTFGCCFVFADAPDLLIGARRSSPLLLGIGDGEYFLASDGSAVLEHTKDVVYLGEGEMVAVSREGYTLTSLDPDTDTSASERAHARSVMRLEMTLDEIEKGGYKHFMIKEIMDQPRSIENAMRGRLNVADGSVRLGGLESHLDAICAARRLILCACGTSLHAGMVGRYMIERLARLPVEVEQASEFRYRDPILVPGEDVVVAISQSGETADTLAAVRLAKERGVLTVGIVNSVGSAVARETDCGAYLHVGPESGVASTKAFTGQVTVLALLALLLGQRKGKLDAATLRRLVGELAAIPDKMRAVLAQAPAVEAVSAAFTASPSFLFLGRGLNFPVALEGALKLKEVSYIHAEGYSAAEMKHGPIALIDRSMPVVLIAPRQDAQYDKIKGNLHEVRARDGRVLLITEDDNHEVDGMAESVLRMPAVEETFAPLLTVVPLQLLSYYIADARGCDVDKPRNLAKAVAVE